MEMVLTIEITGAGVKCRGVVNGEYPYGSQEANLIAVGALEIARSSLLAHRWGLQLNKPLVKEPETTT